MKDTIDKKKKAFLDNPGVKPSTKRMLAYQIEQEIARQRISKARMAELMETSRASLNRLLDPENESVTLQTMVKAAEVLGKNLIIHLDE